MASNGELENDVQYKQYSLPAGTFVQIDSIERFFCWEWAQQGLCAHTDIVALKIIGQERVGFLVALEAPALGWGIGEKELSSMRPAFILEDKTVQKNKILHKTR